MHRNAAAVLLLTLFPNLCGAAESGKKSEFAQPEWTKAWKPAPGVREKGPAFFASPEGKTANAGTKDAPWDLASVLAGVHPLPAGATLWLLPGVYTAPDRKAAF